MKKKIVRVTGSFVTSLMILGASTTFAQVGYKANSDAQIVKIATELGLPYDEVRQELETGKLSPEILKENNIDVSQLKKVLIIE